MSPTLGCSVERVPGAAGSFGVIYDVVHWPIVRSFERDLSSRSIERAGLVRNQGIMLSFAAMGAVSLTCSTVLLDKSQLHQGFSLCHK